MASNAPTPDLLDQLAGSQQPQQSTGDDPLDALASMPHTAAASQDQGFLSGLYNTTAGPVVQGAENLYHGAMDAGHEAGDHLQKGDYLAAAGAMLKGFGHSTPNSYNLIRDLIGAHVQQLKTAAELAKAGRYTEAAGHGLAGITPFVGPVAAKAGEDIGAGKTSEGLGEAAGVLSTALLPEVARQVGKGAKVAKAAFTPVPDTVNESLQSGIRDVASNVASSPGLPATAVEENVPVRQTFEKLANNVQAQSKDLYAEIDNATDGRLTNLQDKLRNVENKMRGLTGVEEVDGAAEDRLTAQKDALNSQIEEVMKQATGNGVDPSIADKARAAWRQQSALRDVDQQLKMSTFGNAKHAAEVIDPAKLVNRLQKLSDTGRLEEALGPENADTLLKQAYDAYQKSQDTAAQNATVAARRGAIKKAAITTGAATVGLGAGGSLIAHALGGKK